MMGFEMKTLYYSMIAISVSLALIAFLQPVHAQNIPNDKNATLIVNFNSSKFSGYQGGPFTPSHDGSMYAFSTSIVDPKSHDWKSYLWLYFMKNGTTRSLDLNSDLSQISYVSFSADDKKLLFVGNGCDSDPSHTTFYVFNLFDIHLKCNGLTNVHDADWMPDGSIVFLQNNEENDTISIYQNGTQKLLYTKQITPPYISLNSSHIESIKASPDGKKIALWYFVMLSHKTQILNFDDGKITDTFDGGHPRWSRDSNMLLYSLPIGTGYYDKGPRSVITYINLLDVDKNKTITIDSVPVGVDDLFLSVNGSKAFYVTKVPSVYDFLNFTSGIYEIDLNHDNNNILGSESQFYNFSTTGGTPLHQFKSGISANDVKCEQGLQLVIKAEDNSPACVKSQTAQKLVERGWGWTMQPIDSLKPLLPNRIAGLENDTGIVTFGNKTYYFETPNYTDTAFTNPAQIAFHDVVFTLFPPGFKGGLPTDFGGVATNGCAGSYFWTDSKFLDGTHELLHIFAITTMSQHCQVLPAPTDFSTHANPQAGLTVYDGKMKLLVSTNNQVSSSLKLNLSTNSTVANQGHVIGIKIWLNNTSSGTTVVNSQDDWSLGGLGLHPCVMGLPFGVGLYDGNYSLTNIALARQLPIYQNGVYNCPPTQYSTVNTYVFQPLSDSALLLTPNGNFSSDMVYDIYLDGFYADNVLEPLKAGAYTIVGGDEWGHAVVQHFLVVNSTKR